MKNRNLEEQFTLFPIDTEFETSKEETTSDGVELVSFRELVPEINDTGYLTHAIFAYPAKFIPQIVRYAIKTYTPKKGIGLLIRSQVQEQWGSRRICANATPFYSISTYF